MIPTKETTCAEFVRAWDAGESVFTVEMGGLGPGYEQAIQVTVVAIVRDNLDTPLPDFEAMEEDARREAWWNWSDDTFKRIDDSLGGLSGAMAGAAKDLAYRFLRDGYGAAMETAPADRKIQVSKAWPREVIA